MSPDEVMRWDPATLATFADAEEVHVAPDRPDGSGRMDPVVIWDVVVDGRLYVRAATGTRSHWWQAARASGTGGFGVATADHEVTFTPDVRVQDAVDDAYRTKYSDSPYGEMMTTEDRRPSTLRVDPA